MSYLLCNFSLLLSSFVVYILACNMFAIIYVLWFYTGTSPIYFVFMSCTISLLVDLLRTGTYYYGYPIYKMTTTCMHIALCNWFIAYFIYFFDICTALTMSMTFICCIWTFTDFVHFSYSIVICFDLIISMTFIRCIRTPINLLFDILFSRIMLIFLSLSLFDVTFCIDLCTDFS